MINFKKCFFIEKITVYVCFTQGSLLDFTENRYFVHYFTDKKMPILEFGICLNFKNDFIYLKIVYFY